MALELQNPEEARKIFSAHIADRKVLVTDPSPGSRSSILRILRDLGAKATNLATASTYDNAAAIIDRDRPQLVITDYSLGDKCGLRLVQRLRKIYPNPMEAMFFLVTANCRESTIAEAAEEDVDGYILKPFSIEIFTENLLRAGYAKLRPSSYHVQIHEGKACLATGKIDEAEIYFDTALTLAEKPVLAFYYQGQTLVAGKKYPRAETSYLKGLELNDVHYRCMKGLFELLLMRARHEEAYTIARKIVEYYPISPQLLDQVLRLAVRAGGFEDIDSYYLVYLQLDERSEELVKCMVAALVVGGKYNLGKRNLRRAVELFKRATVVSNRATPVLREIVTLLLRSGHGPAATEFLREFPAETRKSRDYLTMELALLDESSSDSKSVDAARKLIAGGVDDPEIYEILIRRSQMSAQLGRTAEVYAREAAKKWPHLAEKFLGMAGLEPG